MTVRLRPGAAVYPVEEGLLFCGWQSSALMTCAPGVVKVWQAIEPHLRRPVDPATLRAQLPAPVTGVYDTLLDQLAQHSMLTSVAEPAVPGSPATELLYHAPDVAAAWRRAADTSFRLIGESAQVEMLRALMPSFTLSDQAESLSIYLGPVAGLPDDIAFAAVAVGHQILVAATAAGPDRLRQAAGTLDPAGEPGVGWVIARSVLVDQLLGWLAEREDDDHAVLVDGVLARTVALAPSDRPPAPIGWHDLPAERVESESGMPAETTLGQRLTGPLPLALAQHTVARQQVEWGGRTFDGVGVDQARAGQDALLAATRATLDASLTAAGRNGVDLLADALGRALVAEAAARTGEPIATDLDEPMIRRWLATTGRFGATSIRVGPAERCPAAVLATATVDGRTSWGYGATAVDAIEHALRGLVVRLVTGSTEPRVAVTHELAAGSALVQAVVGRSELPPLAECAAIMAGFGFQVAPWTPGPEFAARGLVSATVAVRR